MSAFPALTLTRRGFLAGSAALAQSQPKPNIVVIVSDDHGYGDVSCYPHPPEVRTPNIDRIAQRGVRFTQGYVSAYVCAPTRAAILTGRYPQRFGFYTASDSRAGLPLSESTLADLLRNSGYTTAAIGKWHLGLDLAHHPLKRGFDEFYGFLGHGGHDYFDLKRAAEDYASIWRNDKVIDETGYLTDNLGREAVRFLQTNRAKPHFLYLAFNAVHFPLQAPAAVIRKYQTGNPKRDTYLAMLEREDAAIGRVLDTVDENTIVVFLSDNGGARNNASFNGSLRDYKHSVYEGGVRVPFLLSWPGRTKPGTEIHDPVICMDILPTLAAAAGAALPAGRVYDGRSLLQPQRDRTFYWDGDEGKRAIRSGQWKLIRNEDSRELYNLDADPAEKNDLARSRPEIVDRLQADFDRWRSQMAPRIRRRG